MDALLINPLHGDTMSMLKTVSIKTKGGPVLINESDYDPKIHTLATKSMLARANKPAREEKKGK